MKPLARVAIPKSSPTNVVDAIKERLQKSWPHINIEYVMQDHINHPMSLSFERNGANLGSIDDDLDALALAISSGIHAEANQVFKKE